jgi:hypothetical protein
MKKLNFSIPLNAAIVSLASVSVTSLGVAAVCRVRHFASLRSVGKQPVTDPHLHVVCLPGEEQERLVLGLPPEAGERTVVAVGSRLARDGVAGDDDVGSAADSKHPLLTRIGTLIGDDGAVGDLIDQAGTEERGRDARWKASWQHDAAK